MLLRRSCTETNFSNLWLCPCRRQVGEHHAGPYVGNAILDAGLLGGDSAGV